MRASADVEVAVLSVRSDLDVVISTRLPGYSATRTDDLDTVIDITSRGGVVLIDVGSPRHEEWVAALGERGFDGPIVFLDPRGEMTLDLRERVVVPSPPSLSGLLSGLEVARSQRQAQEHRRSRRSGDTLEPSRVRRHAAAIPVPRGGSTEPVPRDVSTLDGASEGSSSTRARRVDRRRAERSRSRSSKRTPRRSVDHDVGASAGGGGGGGATAPMAPACLETDVEERFRQAFHAADGQPAIHRRLETPEGRVRIQTEEELFAGHAAASSLATVLTLPSGTRRRQRRARVGV